MFAAALLLWPVLGLADGLPAPPAAAAPRVKLDLSVEHVQLIVQMLGAIGCGTVQQMIVCQQAVDVLGEIRSQAKEQLK